MSYIVGTGIWLPDRIVGNGELALQLDMDADSIFAKTGIRARRWVNPETKTTDLGKRAILEALDDAGVHRSMLDYLIFGTMTPDRFIPAGAATLQSELGLNQIPCIDIRNACCNPIYGLQIGSALIDSGIATTVAICCADIQSRYLDLRPEASQISILFGDAASCIILVKSSAELSIELLDIIIHSNGTHADALGIRAPGTEIHRPIEGDFFPTMNGRAVIANALKSLQEVCTEILERRQISIEEIDWIVPHQANANLFRELARQLDFPLDRIVSVIENTGNTSSASVGLALDYLRKTEGVSSGQKILLPAFAAGFTWGAILGEVI